MKMNGSRRLFTIGYGGATVDRLVAALKAENIFTLVDVRTYPRTRIPGFGKAQLQERLPLSHIEYIHVKELGAANWNDSRPGARADLLNDENKGLQILAEILEQGPVAIMCAEKDYRACHRNYIAERLKAESPDVRVRHLVP